jgi:hypothetical protein
MERDRRETIALISWATGCMGVMAGIVWVLFLPRVPLGGLLIGIGYLLALVGVALTAPSSRSRHVVGVDSTNPALKDATLLASGT